MISVAPLWVLLAVFGVLFLVFGGCTAAVGVAPRRAPPPPPPPGAPPRGGGPPPLLG